MLYSSAADVYSRYIACCLGLVTSAHKPMTSSLLVCGEFKFSAEPYVFSENIFMF